MILRLLFLCLQAILWNNSHDGAHALSLAMMPRRKVLGALGTTSFPLMTVPFSSPPKRAAAAAAAITVSDPPYTPNGLASRLAQRDPALLKNSVFNLPPAAQVFPAFMRGTWNVNVRFNGYLFPSSKISKERLVQNVLVPGFQKCSIAAICDVGKEEASYVMTIKDENGLLEDRAATLKSQVDAFLGYHAVDRVLYDARANANRISIDFVDYKTRNAERIELFCNARESELYYDHNDKTPIFVCSEYIRQVTFGGGPDYGVARQVVGNYAHFWTWKRGRRMDDNDNDALSGNLLTAAYLDPQDPLFFDEPSKPVAIYSHVLSAKRS